MKRAIVTGATGAVGTALLKELVKNKGEVLVICREKSKRNKNIPKDPLIKQINCDLSNLSELKNTTGNKWDVFYHLAWMGTTGVARNDMYLQNKNVEYALDAVKIAKRFGCSTFIGIGSQAEYGRYEGILEVDTPTYPEMGYGYAKLCAGQMTRGYAHELGLQHIWVRILSIYGPNDGMQSMIMSTINKLLNRQVPQLTLGEQLWDYLYSEDAARALYLLANKGKDGKIYVLGSGQAKPLAEYVSIIKNEINPSAEIAFGAIPYSIKQVMHLQADISELVGDTGWKPEVDFKEGIENIIREINR